MSNLMKNIDELLLGATITSAKGYYHGRKIGATVMGKPHLIAPNQRGNRTRMMCLGKVFRLGKVCDSKQNVKHPELLIALRELIKLIDPKFEYQSIQVNQNIVCKPHRDCKNTGHSYIVGFGDYQNGDTVVQFQETVSVNIYHQPINFNGSKHLHWSTDFSGTRFSVIYF
jgi:hypothetical protein